MPEQTTVKLKLASKDPEKKHSRVFEAVGENDVVKSIYFLRPWSNGATEITIVATKG